MTYAEVAVGVRSQPGQTFSYSIPEQLVLNPGHAVQIPFGTRQLPGFVFEITELPGYHQTREIRRVIDDEPWLSVSQLNLARWISATYRSSLYNAASLMIPPGYRQRITAIYRVSPHPTEHTLPSLTKEQTAIHSHIQKGGHVSQSDLDRRYGKRNASVILGQLVRKRVIQRHWEWLKPRVRPKYIDEAELVGDPKAASSEAAKLTTARATRQGTILEAIADAPSGIIPVPDLYRRFGAVRAPIAALVKRDLVRIRKVRVDRDPLAGRSFSFRPPATLTYDQKSAWNQIDIGLRSAGSSSVFLLNGVTSSGKTELYLMALEKVISQGQRGIVLVPEISLTPQTIERFAGRFPGRVAVLHSRLSAGEYFDEWWRIRAGHFDVVIGPRGAIFAPQPDLGLIVLDEEHEWTYKQHEAQPFYHARDVAIRLAEFSEATLILGSATPQIESYHRAKSGEYRLLDLPERVPSISEGGISVRTLLPKVSLVDMRTELRSGNRSVFSDTLGKAVEEALTNHEQVILFLNRRGSATFVQCRDCGYVAQCSKCSATLTYHAEHPTLRCHQCGYRINAPTNCPDCFSPNIRYMGLGTERLDLEVAKSFPQATTLRWDRDVTKGRNSHESILQDFLAHKADILIGTQMIAKGLHLPGVTLVGVVNADIGLHNPDFRSPERVFQVLCQVAGRSGRGAAQGRVIIQTYSPANYAIAAAATQDYGLFYEQEIALRRETGLPPFSRLIRLLFAHTNASAAQTEATRMHDALAEKLAEWAFPNVKLVGPAPAPLERIRGRYRWHIIVQGPDPSVLLDSVRLPDGWSVDVDPVTLM